MITMLSAPTIPEGFVAVLCRKVLFLLIIMNRVSIAGSGRYSFGTEALLAAREPAVGGIESIIKTVDTGSETSHMGSEIAESTSPIW
jgi:hypothetical protein